MTIREHAIFDHLIRIRYLRHLDPKNVLLIQIQNPDTILIWHKDPKDGYLLKQISFIVQPSCEEFINEAIKEHRELAIDKLIFDI